MIAVLARLRYEVRTQWRGLLGLAILVGLVGGAVLGATVGARRTASAYSRYLETARAEDFNLGLPGVNDPEYEGALAGIEAIPEVATVGAISSQELITADGSYEFFALGGLDERVGTEVNRPKMLEGRDADPAVEDEATVNRAMADDLDLSPGDELTLYGFAAGDSEVRANRGRDPEDGRRQVFTITGIALYPNEVVATAPLDDNPRVYLTPAQVQAHLEEAEEFSFMAVRLRRGAADGPAFREHFADLLAEFGVPPDAVPLVDAAERRETVQRAIRPQGQALAAFAILLGLTGLLVVGQAYVRHLSGGAGERRALWALGFTRRQLATVALLRVAVSVVLGAALAVGVAIAVSPLALIGPARLADPDPGVSVDGGVLILGAAALTVALLVRAAFSIGSTLPSPRAAALTANRSPRRTRAVARLARAGAPPPATVGVQMAIEPDDGSPLSSASVLVGTVVAIAAMTAAVTFSVSLDRLVTTPALFGWDWDVQVGGGFDGIPTDPAFRILRTNPDVAGFTAGNTGEMTIESADGRRLEVPTMGLDRVEGDVYPQLVEGRAAEGPDEIVLGSSTMDDLDTQLGDEVTRLQSEAEPRPLEVVGRAVLPAVGAGNFTTAGLGVGGVVTTEVLDTLGEDDNIYTYFLVEYVAGVDRGAADVRLFEAMDPVMTDCGQLCVQGAVQPGDIRNYDRVRATPLALAAVLVVLAMAVLIHTLVTTVRRWRTDLALLTTLGFVRRQSALTSAWHAVTVAGVSLLIGLPVGLALGRVLWAVFADELGVVASATTPWLAIALTVPLALILAVVVAVVPGLAASRTKPAELLRTA